MSKGEDDEVERLAEVAFWAHVAATEAEILGQWKWVREEHKRVWRAVIRSVLKAQEVVGK